jgi:hypothetical protein
MILIVPKEIAETIVKGLEKDYARSYAILAFMQQADVVRWTPMLAAVR